MTRVSMKATTSPPSEAGRSSHGRIPVRLPRRPKRLCGAVTVMNDTVVLYDLGACAEPARATGPFVPVKRQQDRRKAVKFALYAPPRERVGGTGMGACQRFDRAHAPGGSLSAVCR
jgi:hypothetical protein